MFEGSASTVINKFWWPHLQTTSVTFVDTLLVYAWWTQGATLNLPFFVFFCKTHIPSPFSSALVSTISRLHYVHWLDANFVYILFSAEQVAYSGFNYWIATK